MTPTETAALFKAASILVAAGFHFDSGSSFVAHGIAHAFSSESANGTSAGGPAAWVDVHPDGAAFINNRPVGE